tara:strand:+ start:24322 stop:24897 length:576 start_codon:yes stop_codon:yes gene_type:complete
MADIMKHVGSYGEKPCVVVFREVPNEPDHCLIVESASLEDSKHDSLMNIVSSLEAQESNDISEVLSRRQFTDGTNMLNDLHFSKKLIKVPVDMVFLTPTPSQKISLKEVNAEINKIETGSNPPLNVDVDPGTLQTPNPVDVSGDASAAESLLVQAEMIEQDANKLMEDAESKKAEAYKLDPSLKPKKSKAK